MRQSNIFEYLKYTNPKDRATIYITADDKSSQKVESVADFLGIEAFVLPSIRVNRGQDLRSYNQEISTLLERLLSYYKCNKDKILVSPFYTLTLPLPKSDKFDSFLLEFAQELDIKELKDKLLRWGYHFVDIVEAKGEVSFRGDIIDIYPPSSNRPFRISLFDNEIEAINPFDIKSQKRDKNIELESIEVVNRFLALNESEYNSLKYRVEYSPYESFIKDIDSLGLWHLDELGIDYIDSFKSILCEDISSNLDEFYSINDPLIPKSRFNLPILPEAKKYRDLEVVDINKLIEAHKDKKIYIVAKNESVARASQIKDIKAVEFIYKDAIINLISDEELIISLNKATKQRRVKRASIILDELKVGEYVVHESHGVGIFQGIEKRKVLGANREFVVLKYQNDDTLLLPVENLDVIDRYIAEGGSLPSLDKLGKASFRKLKAKVREKLFAIASQIINISAQRALKEGIKIDIDFKKQTKFLLEAGFSHTPDQEEAIRDILDELSSGKVMDRLLSADVGFGKTEVAMNAIFATVNSGYQAMMIAPTTLLSSQHFKSLKERFEPWGIEVARLDRFTTPSQKRDIAKRLKSGELKVVVGTHALLKLEFKNLALVVIDEEHKFGVKQKEALKEMALDVHLLSMSATPIPRSLNMALSEIKSFSEILTPPSQRVGVRTFVKNYDPSIIKEAILREIRRGGQIFYIYNSIAGIESKAEELKELIPNLRMSILHSKVSASKTEEEMIKFEEGEYDLLLSTSIVESGIHLPNANTIIVDGAERFGIADLHQLRGRVGRGGKEGYCYFIVEDRDNLSESATRRLLALESHSELGSGATLAFHDLQIRGGGNIIGEAQSGHIKQIGYSLYLSMLEDAIRELSGKAKADRVSVDINLQVDAYLSDELIAEDRLRLELYRRLSLAKSVDEIYEIEQEINDRFGKLDTLSKQFIDIMIIKVLAKSKGINKVSSYGDKVFIEFVEDNKDRVILKSPSKDDDDIIATALEYLRDLK